MSWAAVAAGVGGLVAGGASYLASDSGGSGSSSQTTQVSPASWDALGGSGIGTDTSAEGLWDSFVSKIMGGGVAVNNVDAGLAKIDAARNEKYAALSADQKTRYDWIQNRKKQIKDWQYAHNDHTGFQAEYDKLVAEESQDFKGLNSSSDRYREIQRRKEEIEDYRRAHGTIAFDSEYNALLAEEKSDFGDLYLNESGETLPSLEEMMNANYASQEQTGQQYLSDMEKAGNTLAGSTAANTGQYQGSLDTIGQNAQTPYMQFAIGGQKQNAISKRQLSLADTLSQLAQDKYKAGGIMNQTNYDVQSGSADRALNQGMQFTPYGADIQYIDKLWPILSQLQGYRFGTPSTVESSTANVGTTLAEKMAALAQGAQTGSNLWSLFQPSTTTAQPYSAADIAAGNYTPV